MSDSARIEFLESRITDSNAVRAGATIRELVDLVWSQSGKGYPPGKVLRAAIDTLRLPDRSAPPEGAGAMRKMCTHCGGYLAA